MSAADAVPSREEKPGPVTVEVDYGSASSRGRAPGTAWMVRMRRADKSVIVAIGLTRSSADRLAFTIAELLDPSQKEVVAR